MRKVILFASLLAVTAAGLCLPGMAQAGSVNIGVQTDNLNLGIAIGPTPPPLVVVPAPVVVAPSGPPPPPAYSATGLPYNYFVYQNVYYLYHEERWFRARRHNGPWTAIAITQVPRPILAIPVEHYTLRPEHWEQHGPPPWAGAGAGAQMGAGAQPRPQGAPRARPGPRARRGPRLGRGLAWVPLARQAFPSREGEAPRCSSLSTTALIQSTSLWASSSSAWPPRSPTLPVPAASAAAQATMKWLE